MGGCPKGDPPNGEVIDNFPWSSCSENSSGDLQGAGR